MGAKYYTDTGRAQGVGENLVFCYGGLAKFL